MKSVIPDRIPAELACSQCGQKSEQLIPRKDPQTGNYTCPGCGATFHLTADQARTIKDGFGKLDASLARFNKLFRK